MMNFAIIIMSNDFFAYTNADFVASISEIYPQGVSQVYQKEGKEYWYAYLYGYLQLSDDVIIHYISKSGHQNTRTMIEGFVKHFAQPLGLQLIGYVILVDIQYVDLLNIESNSLEGKSSVTLGLEKAYFEKLLPTFKEKGWLYIELAKQDIQIVSEISPSSPFIIAVPRHNAQNAFPINQLHEGLNIPHDIPIISYDPTEPEDVKQVILQLFEVAQFSPNQ